MAVREGLLALLGQGERHGYQLKTDFEAATGGAWSLNVGQVYTTLDRLRRDGLVEADEGGGQKRWSITAAGRHALVEWWEAAGGDDPPRRDELLVKVLLAVDGEPRRALRVITRQRTALTRQLQERRRAARRRDAPSGLPARLVADALVVRAEADLRWLDLCEAHLAAEGPSRDENGAPRGRS